MSTMIPTHALRHQDLFELPNGSVYEVVRHGTVTEARLWCAHAPDVTLAEPPLIPLPTAPTVHLLHRHDQGAHTQHPGYVRHAFEQEMDRRHQERMQDVYERQARAAAETRQREAARRPWWRRLGA